MTTFSVLVVDVNGTPLPGKVVKACKTGFDKSCYQVTTDQTGTATFNITAWNETVDISVEGLTTGLQTINVDWLGNANPSQVTIRTNFQPFLNTQLSVQSFTDYFKGLGSIATVVIIIVAGIIIYFLAKKYLVNRNFNFSGVTDRIGKYFSRSHETG